MLLSNDVDMFFLKALRMIGEGPDTFVLDWRVVQGKSETAQSAARLNIANFHSRSMESSSHLSTDTDVSGVGVWWTGSCGDPR
jgi:hypothetical protein